MAESEFLTSYPALVARLRAAVKGDAALETAVGGDFLTVGKLEYALLRSLGLSAGHLVVDVGCGSGRLAVQLSPISGLRYLGTDVVPDLLDHARKITQREDWSFECTQGLTIPAEDGSADFVCFFSVFTHLTYQDTFRYLREARRVLKRGGQVVFSFLEFHIPSHWTIFENTIANHRPGDHLNQFIDRHAIAAWAGYLGLKVEFIADGDKPHIPIDEVLLWADGRMDQDRSSLGQSVAVLSKSLPLPETRARATPARTEEEEPTDAGKLQSSLLRSLGLADGHLVIDVGCGDGRLAGQLTPFPHIGYIGCDPSPELLAQAKERAGRAGLRLVQTDGATIPCEAAQADFIGFFSVFKHLAHADIFHYFLEAHRKLKPGGLLVMSFLEFQVPAHGESFIAGIDAAPADQPNQFIDREAIGAWAAHSGFDLQRIDAGDVPHIQVQEGDLGKNGAAYVRSASLGESVAVLQKRRLPGGATARPKPTLNPHATPLRMTNTSSRFFIGAGEKVFVTGLVLRGTGAKSYLVRAIGPTLASFNVSGVLSAPTLTVYDEEGTVIASGHGWDAALADTFAIVGAFALPAGSADAALVITLTEGRYSIAVSGEGSGVALAEVYELPITRDRLG